MYFTLNLMLFPQIFKTAEELDLGCGVGGGRDSKDIFKVGFQACYKDNSH